MQENKPREPSDRRKDSRFPVRPGIRASCHTGSLNLGRDLALEVLDVSGIGLRLLVSEPLTRGEVVEVGLTPADGEEVRRLGVVVSSEEQAGDIWLAGIVLSRGLGSDTLRTFCQLPEG